MRIAVTFPDAAAALDRLARVCMSIRSIDGQPMRAITNLVELTAVANAVGDIGIDELNFWFDRHWGNLRNSDLQLLKKMCGDSDFREAIKVARYGQPWSEARAMDPMERKASLYSQAEFDGCTVDWQTGKDNAA